jgi:hypothetical protein
MSVTLNEGFNSESFKAASALGFGAAVVLNTAVAFSVLPASGGSAGQAQVYGITQASAPTPGQNVTIQTGGWAKAIAAASLGIGGIVGAGLGTTSLAPVMPSGVASGPSAIQPARFAVGIALENAAAGAIFTVSLHPGEVV